VTRKPRPLRIPERNSARLRKQPAPATPELPEDKDEEEKLLSKRRRATVPVSQNVGEPARFAPAAGAFAQAAVPAGSSRALSASVAKLAQWVGKSILPTDGSGAMKLAAMQRLHGSQRQISFNKYSGVIEFQNCVALFMNVRGKAGYQNMFLEAGRVMTFYGAAGMTADTPAMRRILASQGSTAVTGINDIVLFCREEGCAYVYAGPVAMRCYYPQSAPLKLELVLLEHSRLVGAPDWTALFDDAG
jgi:hypothetical protein